MDFKLVFSLSCNGVTYSRGDIVSITYTLHGEDKESTGVIYAIGSGMKDEPCMTLMNFKGFKQIIEAKNITIIEKVV